MNANTARIPYEACPLCDATDLVDVAEASCTHYPLYTPELPDTIRWRGCRSCGHIFTDGYFTDEALERIFQKAHPKQTPGKDIEAGRLISARIVTTVSTIRGELGGRWLDVGFGNGSLMTTADEFGYQAVGIDLRESSVKLMRDFGYQAHCVELTQFREPSSFDVVSMADVLEHMPFPRQALEHVHMLLRQAGLLFVAMPNMDCFVWKVLDQDGKNPYWGELEHYHNFGRDRLYALLGACGFAPCYYAVSERYRAGMEVVARKLPP